MVAQCQYFGQLYWGTINNYDFSHFSYGDFLIKVSFVALTGGTSVHFSPECIFKDDWLKMKWNGVHYVFIQMLDVLLLVFNVPIFYVISVVTLCFDNFTLHRTTYTYIIYSI